MPHGRGGSWIWPATRWAVYFRDKFRCVHCGVRVIGGATPESMYALDRRKRGWAPGFRGWKEDHRVACIDHPRPGAKPSECVTSCWQCNSSAQDRDRVIEVEPLTGYHRIKGRELYKTYCRQRDRKKVESKEQPC